jgi:hypothetical protein
MARKKDTSPALQYIHVVVDDHAGYRAAACSVAGRATIGPHGNYEIATNGA